MRGWEDLQPALAGAALLYTHVQDGEGACAVPESLAGADRLAVADPWDGRPNRSSHFVSRLRTRFPGAEIRALDPVLRAQRLIKSPAEVVVCRQAGRLAALGLCEAMRATRPGVWEYQLDAVMRYHYLAGGARSEAYHAIVGGGRNAWHGHYGLNADPLVDGDLVLVDCGPDYHYYASDITRMWPVNGVFTPAQRALYGFVTEYHNTGAPAHPGHHVQHGRRGHQTGVGPLAAYHAQTA